MSCGQHLPSLYRRGERLLQADELVQLCVHGVVYLQDIGHKCEAANSIS